MKPILQSHSRFSAKMVLGLCALLAFPSAVLAQSATDTLAANAPAPGEAKPAPPVAVPAGSANLNLFPRRVILTSGEPIAMVGIYNNGLAPGSYQIATNDMVMGQDGLVSDAASAPPEMREKLRAGTEYLRLSPRRANVAPNGSQTVRLMMDMPKDAAPGEYRTHLRVTLIPSEASGFSIENTAQQSSREVSLSVRPRITVTIPVIMRVGNPQVALQLSDMAVDRDAKAPSFGLDVHRQGDKSAFGGLRIVALPSGKTIAVLEAMGIYAEIDKRHAKVPMMPDVDPELFRPGAQVRAIFVDSEDNAGKVLASQEFTLP